MKKSLHSAGERNVIPLMNIPSLFVQKEWKMHSGGKSEYKIECDALTHTSLMTLGKLAIDLVNHPIRSVYGVPTGGEAFAEAIKEQVELVDAGIDLIVDDVLTTGNSMNEARKQADILGFEEVRGIVIFSRTTMVPTWVLPIFQQTTRQWG